MTHRLPNTLHSACHSEFRSAFVALAIAMALVTGPVLVKRAGAQQAGAQAGAQAEPEKAIVDQVVIQGNRYLQAETYTFYISTKAGDRFDLLRLRDDFRRLWNTGFLDDLVLEVTDSPRGKLVTFVLEERKRIQLVDYRGSKQVKADKIEEALEENDSELRLDSFYDINAAKKVEGIIRELLAEKGYRFATVKHEAKVLGGAGMHVSFLIEDGPKSKLEGIEFVGNEVFSDGTLRAQMKEMKQPSFIGMTWLKGNTKYTNDKWDTDAESIRAFYLSKGYVQAKLGEPTLALRDSEPDKEDGDRLITLSVPVEEGPQYTLGTLEFEGLTVFTPEYVRSLIKLEQGQIYDDSKLDKAIEGLQEVYGRLGYFQFTGYAERKPDGERGIVDVVLHVEEDLRYFVGRIAFTGNDQTRDKVVRREVYLNEGAVFDTEMLKASITRINQLGYFKPIEAAPKLGPSDLGEDKIDVTFDLEEQNRNQFTFGGGVSGLEGTFVNLSFSTQNFLGRGETFNIAAQTGRRTQSYQFAVTSPFFLDRPITAGFDLFKRRITYQTFAVDGVLGYTDDRKGFRLISGKPLGRWGRFFMNYSYEIITISTGELSEEDLRNPLPGQLVDPRFLQQDGKRTESRIGPSYSWNTVNDPFMPSAGNRQTVSMQITGGILGGDLDYLRPVIETVWYFPHTRRTSLGVRGEFGWIHPYGTTAQIGSETGLDSLPFYLRFFLGGENQIRGYPIRSIGPRDENGFAVGGNKYYLFNAEYYINIFGSLRMLFFYDAGQAFADGNRMNLTDVRTSTGVELRFVMPVLNVPFRLIYAFNPQRDAFQPAKTFKFAVGTTF